MSSGRDTRSAFLTKMIQDFKLNPDGFNIPKTDDKALLERLAILKQIIEDTRLSGLNLIQKHENELKNQKKEENFIHNKATYSNLEYELKSLHEFYQKSLTDFYNALNPIAEQRLQDKKNAFENSNDVNQIRMIFAANSEAILVELKGLNMDTASIEEINKQFNNNASLDIANIKALNNDLSVEVVRQKALIENNKKIELFRIDFEVKYTAIKTKLAKLGMTNEAEAIDVIANEFNRNKKATLTQLETINQTFVSAIADKEALIKSNMQTAVKKQLAEFNTVHAELFTLIELTARSLRLPKTSAAVLDAVKSLKISDSEKQYDSNTIDEFHAGLSTIKDMTLMADSLLKGYKQAVYVLENPEGMPKNMTPGVVKILGDYLGEAAGMADVSLGDHLSSPEQIAIINKYPLKLQAIITLYKKFIQHDDKNSINTKEFAEMVDGILKEQGDLRAKLVINICNNKRLDEMGLCLAICLNKDTALSQTEIHKEQLDNFLFGLNYFLLDPKQEKNRPYNAIILDQILNPANISKKVREIRNNPLSNHETIQSMVLNNFGRTNIDNVELLRQLNATGSPELEKIASQVDSISSHINAGVATLAKNKPVDYEKDAPLLNSFKPKVINILLTPKLTDEMKYIKITEAANAHFNRSSTVKRVLNRVMEAIENLLGSKSKTMVRTRLFSSTTQSSLENKIRTTLKGPIIDQAVNPLSSGVAVIPGKR